MSDERHHPDDLELELARTGEAEPWVERHLEGCGACSERAGRLEAWAASMRAEQPSLEIPELVEARILRDATKVRSGGGARRRSRWIAAAAAAAVLLLTLPWTLRRPEQVDTATTETFPPTHAVSDLNRDGVTDILDAYRLALGVENGDTDPGWDFDRNGRVDGLDARALARAIVAREERL